MAALEEDKEFAKKLENVSMDAIKSGAIANELHFVDHNVRSKLDELKRLEMDRLRKLTKKEHDLLERQDHHQQAKNGGKNEDTFEDGRRWRSLNAKKNSPADTQGHKTLTDESGTA